MRGFRSMRAGWVHTAPRSKWRGRRSRSPAWTTSSRSCSTILATAPCFAAVDRSRGSMFFVGTSWKMNKTLAEARAYAARLVAAGLDVPADVELVLFPPFTALAVVRQELGEASVRLGGQ